MDLSDYQSSLDNYDNLSTRPSPAGHALQIQFPGLNGNRPV
jgi:hypothetical protein